MNILAHNSKLVFDFDGVIFHNTRVNQKIIEKSVGYVQSKTGYSYEKSLDFNNTNYQKYGHTALMLKKYGYDASLEEYNDYVFDSDLWSNLRNNISNDDYIRVECVNTANSLLGYNGILFSNAPYIWCYKVLDMLNYDIDELFSLVYTGIGESSLKPNSILYEVIEYTNKDVDELHFFDDNKKNLENLSDKWTTHHVDPNIRLDNYVKPVVDEIIRR